MATNKAMVLSATHGQQPPSRYEPGVKLDIRAHIPPPPFGKWYKNEDTVRHNVHGLQADDQIDRLNFALSYPPLETDPPAQAKSHMLTILKKIHYRQVSVGGPHVVCCYLDSDESRQYVAKIYDGVDYPLVDYSGCDCMYLADRDYSCEAAAYMSMPSLQGSIVPRYFGSWTFSVETGMVSQYRCVRLILLEHVDSECMLDMILHAKGVTRPTQLATIYNTIPVDYQLLPPEPARLSVVASIIEAEIALFQAGIVLRCLSPRNVMISRSPKRVILIDFNLSLVYKHCEFGRQFLSGRDPMELPISPIERYWNDIILTEQFGQWIPQTWLMDRNSMLQWLCTRWGGSTEFAPLSKDFLRRHRDHPLVQGLSSVTAGKTRYNATSKIKLRLS